MRKLNLPEWLDVARLSRTDWRVSDTRSYGTNSERIVGFVEKLARDRYEVLWMTEPLRWAYVDSLQLALEGFVDPSKSDAVILLARAEPLSALR